MANGIWSNIEPRCELDNLEAIIGIVVVVTVIIILSVLILIVLCVLYCQRRVTQKLSTHNYDEDETPISLSTHNYDEDEIPISLER